MIAEGRIKQGSVAVTFDDGYRDNLMTALPIMRESKTPGTFFISGDGASEAVPRRVEARPAHMQGATIGEAPVPGHERGAEAGGQPIEDRRVIDRRP